MPIETQDEGTFARPLSERELSAEAYIKRELYTLYEKFELGAKAARSFDDLLCRSHLSHCAALRALDRRLYSPEPSPAVGGRIVGGCAATIVLTSASSGTSPALVVQIGSYGPSSEAGRVSSSGSNARARKFGR